MTVSKVYLSSSNNYVVQRENDINHIKNLIKRNPNIKIEYARTDNWVKINNQVVNAISREDIKKIYKSLDINMPEEGGQ